MGPGPFLLHNVNVDQGKTGALTKWNARKGKLDKVKDERVKTVNCDNVTTRRRRVSKSLFYAIFPKMIPRSTSQFVAVGQLSHSDNVIHWHNEKGKIHRFKPWAQIIFHIVECKLFSLCDAKNLWQCESDGLHCVIDSGIGLIHNVT